MRSAIHKGLSIARAPLFFSLFNAFLFIIYFYWLSSYRTWGFDTSTYEGSFGGNFYWLQAQAMLDGQLHLPTEGFECLFIDGQCHGYFGPFPSLLRLPFVMLWGDTYVALSPIFLTLAAGIALFSFTHLLVYIFQRSKTGVHGWPQLWSLQIFIFALGASSLLILSAHPRVYEEAVLWSAAFVSLAINFFYRWYVERRTIFLPLIVFCGCASVLSKVTSMPFFAVLGFFLIFISLRKRHITLFLWGSAIGGIPFLVYTVYTYVHLGFLGFDANYYWPYNNNLIMRAVIDSNDGATVGVQFLPTVIANHFRLDNISLISDWPFITISQDWFENAIYVWPMNPGQMFLAYSPGWLAVVPGTLILGVAGVVHLIFRKHAAVVESKYVLLLLYFAASANALLSMSYFAMNARYLTDVYPMMSVGIIFLALGFYSGRNHFTKTRIAFLAILLVSCLYSAIAMASLHVDIVPFL